MSNPAKKHKITVKYHCTETGQEAEFSFKYSEPDEKGMSSVVIDMEFGPEISKESKDPIGILGKLLNAFE